jgi:putative tricarboxylic transport membrane protein
MNKKGSRKTSATGRFQRQEDIMESKKITIIESILLLIISLAVFFEGVRLMRVTTRLTQDVMGPGTYIIILGGLLILGTLIHISSSSVSILRFKKKHLEEPHERGATFTVLAMVGIIALYAALIQFLGYLIATPIFFLLMFRVVGVNSWRRNVALTVILSAVYYFIFVHYCSVIFPRGIFYG